MKKKNLLKLVASLTLGGTAALGMAFAGCAHEHTFEDAWGGKDETGHWHQATCGHDDEKGDFAEHKYGTDGKAQYCLDCNYENPDYVAPAQATKLAAPVIELEGEKLSWKAVANATGYDVYKDGKKVTSVTKTEYTITDTEPGSYVYTVKATSTDTAKYKESDASNSKTYTVEEPAEEYTITLDANGGTLEDDAETAEVTTKDGKIETLPTPTAPAGMEFVGWYTEDEGGDEVTTETPFEEDSEIYAHYIYVYTVTLDAGEGTCETESIKAKSGIIEELPEPTPPENYEFVGWYTTAEDTEDVTGVEVTTETEVEEDITIYARYALVYTVTLNVGESGTLPEGTETTLTTKGGKLQSLPTPDTENAMLFLGWYTTAEDTEDVTGVEVTTDTLFEGEQTAVALYARYQQEASVTLSVGEGTLPEGTVTTLITADNKLAELPEPTAPEDHWFKGWYTAEEGGTKVSAATNLLNLADSETHAITLYARYVAEVTVTLDVGDGGTVPEGTVLEYKTLNGKIQLPEGERGLPAVTVSKDHWLFYGWLNGSKTVDVEKDVFETETTLTAKIAQQTGLWSADGETFKAALTRNQGNTSITEYWFGGKKEFFEKDTVLTVYIDGVKKTNFWLKGALTNGGANGKTVSSITINEDANFEVYIKFYPDGGTTFEFNGSPAAFKVVNEVDENCTEITVTWGSSHSIKFYLLDSTGAPVSDLSGYYLYAYKGGDQLFGSWQNLVISGDGALKENMTGSTSVTAEDITFIFRWGNISTTNGNGGSQTDNLGGMLPGHSYLINLGNNQIKEYVAPEEGE